MYVFHRAIVNTLYNLQQFHPHVYVFIQKFHEINLSPPLSSSLVGRSKPSYIYLLPQLGPQQLKHMTVLRDSSDCLAFSSLTLLEAMAEEEEESFWA